MKYEICLDKEYINKNNKILEHFGIDHQYKKLVEELKELQDSLEQYRNKCLGKHDYKVYVCKYWEEAEDFLSEISDCFVLAEQLCETGFVNNLIKIYMDYWGILWTNSIVDNGLMINLIDRIQKIMQFKIDRTIERYSINIKKILEVD